MHFSFNDILTLLDYKTFFFTICHKNNKLYHIFHKDKCYGVFYTEDMIASQQHDCAAAGFSVCAACGNQSVRRI